MRIKSLLTLGFLGLAMAASPLVAPVSAGKAGSICVAKGAQCCTIKECKKTCKKTCEKKCKKACAKKQKKCSKDKCEKKRSCYKKKAKS